MSAARHPRQQRRRPAAGRLPRLGSRRWIRALDANMLTPIELIKATVDGMIARKFGRIVNITSSRGQGADRRPRPVERRAQRADRLRRRPRAQGRAAQRDDQQPAARPVRHRPPARRRSTPRAKAPGKPVEEIARRRDGRDAVRALRRSRANSAPICAFLCSVHAGYIVGQNILADGGAYPGHVLIGTACDPSIASSPDTDAHRHDRPLLLDDAQRPQDHDVPRGDRASRTR